MDTFNLNNYLYNNLLLTEIKAAKPVKKIIPTSYDTFKLALIEDVKTTAIGLEFENPEGYVQHFTNKLNKIPNNEYSLTAIRSIYSDLGWGDEEFDMVLKRIFIK